MDPQQRSDFDAMKRASVAQLLFRCARLVNDQALARIQAAGGKVTAAHTRLLPHLDFEGVRPSVLAEKTGLTKQAVGQLLKELESEGVVARERDPSDGRAVLVRFTPKGLDAMKHGLGVLGDLERDLSERVGEDRMRRLHQDLLALDEVLSAR